MNNRRSPLGDFLMWYGIGALIRRIFIGRKS